MYNLTYISEAKVMFSEDELDNLIEEAALANMRNDISGCLLFKEGLFFQYIEGPKPRIKALEQRLDDDPRHVITHRFYREDNQPRRFPSWHMQQVDSNVIEKLRKDTQQVARNDWFSVEGLPVDDIQQTMMASVELLVQQYSLVLSEAFNE